MTAIGSIPHRPATLTLAQAPTQPPFDFFELQGLINKGTLFNPPNPDAIKYISDHLGKGEDEPNRITHWAMDRIKNQFLQAVLSSPDIPNSTKDKYRNFLNSYNRSFDLNAYEGTLSLVPLAPDIPYIEVGPNGKFTEEPADGQGPVPPALADSITAKTLFSANSQELFELFYRNSQRLTKDQGTQIKKLFLSKILDDPSLPSDVKQEFLPFKNRPQDLALNSEIYFYKSAKSDLNNKLYPVMILQTPSKNPAVIGITPKGEMMAGKQRNINDPDWGVWFPNSPEPYNNYW
jgi:hypothetical protein